MNFYLFRLEKIAVKHERGNGPDDDVISFSVLVNQVDRGHGSAMFPSMGTNSVATTDDITEDGLPAYEPGNRLNISGHWEIGPLEITPSDNVLVAYTGTNTSDSSRESLSTQERDELEIKILNTVAKKFAGLAFGAGLGDEIGSAFSDAFNAAFSDPVGELIGYKRVGPCNGPVFAGGMQFSGADLDNLSLGPLTYTLYPGTRYPRTVTSEYPGIRFKRTYTDATTHDTAVCGDIAETDVTFSVFRAPFVSVRVSVAHRFPSRSPALGLRQYTQPGSTISIKSLLGLLP